VVTWQRSTLIIQDTLIFPQWKILNDIREIAGQICMNATFTDTLKGQQIIAWFSLSYPSFAGPERLSGLPGLILGVEVNNGALEIMAVSIDTVPLIHQLTMPDRFDGRRIRGEQITEESFRQKVQQYMAEQRKAGRFPFWGIRY
jgi:GLPGLI family protein